MKRSEATYPLDPQTQLPTRPDRVAERSLASSCPGYGQSMGLFSSDVARAFGQCRTADGPEYWDDPDSRAHEHHRHVRNLLIACAFFVVTGLVVHPSLLALLAVLGPLLALEWFMLRRTGDRRSYETATGATDVEIELQPRE